MVQIIFPTWNVNKIKNGNEMWCLEKGIYILFLNVSVRNMYETSNKNCKKYTKIVKIIKNK